MKGSVLGTPSTASTSRALKVLIQGFKVSTADGKYSLRLGTLAAPRIELDPASLLLQDKDGAEERSRSTLATFAAGLVWHHGCVGN